MLTIVADFHRECKKCNPLQYFRSADFAIIIRACRELPDSAFQPRSKIIESITLKDYISLLLLWIIY